MEALIEQQMAQLREEQAQLERQLNPRPDAVVPNLATGNGRQVCEISVNQSGSVTPAAAAAARAMDANLPLSERLAQLEVLKRKYQRQATKAMNSYFAAVNGAPQSGSEGHQQQKKAQTTPRPFTFESREQTRPTRIRERRLEAERQHRERQEREMCEARFTATPVPPTTFLNKYDLMVEEWCARKAAAERRARELADVAREEATFVRLSAQGLRRTREELMGAVYDSMTGQPLTRAQMRDRAERAASGSPRRRAQSADCVGRRCGVRAVITQPEDVPLEVRMRLWPAIKEHERVRQERIRLAAQEAKKEADVFFQTTMPLLSSPTPHLLGAGGDSTQVFGIGQPITQQVPQVQQVQPQAVQPIPGAAVAPLSAPLAVSMPAPVAPAVAPVHQPLSDRACITVPLASAAPVVPPVTAPVRAVPASATTVATAAAAAAVKGSRSRSRSATRNPNLTFHPRVRPGVPDFKELWAADKVQLLERKKSRPPTSPRPFALAPSAKDGVVRGKRPSRAVSQPPPLHRRSPAGRQMSSMTAAGAPGAGAVAAAKKTAEAAAATSSAAAVAKGTKAHALRTEAVYAKYLSKAAGVDHTSVEDEALRQEMEKRRRETARRIAEYLPDAHAEHEAAIRAKVRALRAAAKESDAAAAQQLAEMRARVAQMPPLFAEPTTLNDASKARAAVEQEVACLLQKSGLNAATIRDILVNPGTENGEVDEAAGEASVAEGDKAAPTDAPAAEAAEAAGSTASPSAAHNAVDVAAPVADAGANAGATKESKKSSSSSSSSSSPSPSDSSSSTTLSSPTKGSPSSTHSLAVPPPNTTQPFTSLPSPSPLTPAAAARGAASASTTPSAQGSLAPSVPAVAPEPMPGVNTSKGYDEDSFESSSGSSDDGSSSSASD